MQSRGMLQTSYLIFTKFFKIHIHIYVKREGSNHQQSAIASIKNNHQPKRALRIIDYEMQTHDSQNYSIQLVGYKLRSANYFVNMLSIHCLFIFNFLSILLSVCSSYFTISCYDTDREIAIVLSFPYVHVMHCKIENRFRNIVKNHK